MYKRVSDILGFLADVKLTAYSLDARSMQITCNACPEIKKIAQKFGLEVKHEEEISLTYSEMHVSS